MLKAHAIQLNNSWTAFPNWYGKKKKAFHQIRHWELELSATNSQDLSDDQDCSAVFQVITTGKDGPRKKTRQNGKFQ